MASFAKRKAKTSSLAERFDEAVAMDTDSQCELFMKSFIFTLGDEWKTVVNLSKSFADFVMSAGSGNDCSCIQAAHFLQKNGKTRTGLQRKQELKDVDLNSDNRICFLEYLLLHYKAMILRAHYERIQKTCPFDLSNDGVGIVGCGPQLLEELFTFPGGLPADLQAALDEFFAKKRAKAARLKILSKKALLPGVKGLTAKNEIAQINAQGTTEMNRLEITLNAAKRRAMRKGGGGNAADVLAAKQKKAEAAAKQARKAARAKLKARAAMFNTSAKEGSNVRRVPSFLKKSRLRANRE